MKQKKLKAWLYDYGKGLNPHITLAKPTSQGLLHYKKTKVKVYEVEIIYKKEI